MLGINASQSEFRCPHCGHTQVESSHLISTFCRACGQHYSVEPTKSTPIRKKQDSKKAIITQALICHRCGLHQRVSVHAQTTLCIQCSTSIHLTDVLIAQSTSQEVDTRGELTILPEVCLEGGFSICNSAVIKGKFSGILLCEQTVRFFGEGRCRAKLRAKRVVIEAGADLYFHFPIYTEELVVYGQLAASILCRGIIRIHRKGFLDGLVRARAMEVFKFGRYTGNLHIHCDEPQEAPPAPFEKFPQLKPHRFKRRIPSGESPI